MLDFLIELLDDLINEGDEIVNSVSEIIVDTVSNINLDDIVLISSAIYVANLTVSSIQDELRNRKELKAKGATNVIIKDFINKSGYTEVSFVAMNAQGKQVGKFSMQGRTCSGLHKGQQIAI
jgi:protoheme ferro-lyase